MQGDNEAPSIDSTLEHWQAGHQIFAPAVNEATLFFKLLPRISQSHSIVAGPKSLGYKDLNGDADERTEEVMIIFSF